MEVSGHLHAPTTLRLGKKEPPQYTFDRRLGGPQSWSEYSGKEKKSQHCPCWELNPSHPVMSYLSPLI